MIDVEIYGPVSTKQYIKLKKLLKSARTDLRTEERISVDYGPSGLSECVADIHIKQRSMLPDIFLVRIAGCDWKERPDIEAEFAKGKFTSAVALFAAGGHTKALVAVRTLLYASYGGADFTLVDPGEDLFYYEARIAAKDPAGAKEAKFNLEQLAKKIRLPVWGQSEMTAFHRRLNERVNYVYDYEVQGPEHFKERFGI